MKQKQETDLVKHMNSTNVLSEVYWSCSKTILGLLYTLSLICLLFLEIISIWMMICYPGCSRYIMGVLSNIASII